MHGSGAGIVAALLEGGATEVSEIRSEVNPAFPGMKQPEPVEDNLAPLISAIKDHDRHSRAGGNPWAENAAWFRRRHRHRR